MIRFIILFIVLLSSSCSSHSKRIQMDERLIDFDKEWNYSKPSETREKFLKILEELKEFVPLDYQLEMKTQIARTYSLEAKFSEAHQLLNEIEEKLGMVGLRVVVRYYLERGRTYNSSGEKEKAKKNFLSAFDNSQKDNLSNFSIDAVHMLVLATESLEEKIQWSEKGIEFVENTADEELKGWKGIFLNNLGWAYFEEKAFEKALQTFKECKLFYTKRGDKYWIDVSRWSYAKTLRLLGKLDAALSIQLDLMNEKNGNDESGYGQEELGEIYLTLGEIETSKEWFKKAYEILSQDSWFVNYEKERLIRIKKYSF